MTCSTDVDCAPGYFCSSSACVKFATIAAGYDHPCAVTTAGGALCWGVNSQGELGNGSTTAPGGLVVVTGLSSGVSAISVGRSTRER
ncbi:MAG: hypothetical protein FWD17_17425 [Polyangiaceae bacterium]|nr:hypothetical protein [Polyangiaceae bacterium]